MNFLLILLSIVFGIAGLWCTILIYIDMFQDGIWIGLVGLLCGLYYVYYCLFEYENENKWLIVLIALGGAGISGGLLSLMN